MLDFAISENGELLIDSEGQIKIREDDDLIKQTAMNRIKSVSDNWFNSLNCADLEQFIGKARSFDTIKEIEDAIMHSLTFDDFLNNDEIFFAKKIMNNEIQVIVFIRKRFGVGPMILSVNIELAGGGRITYETNHK